MGAYDIQEAETLADLYASITAIQPLLVKQVRDLNYQELEQLLVYQSEFIERRQELASRVVAIRLALRGLDERLAGIEEAAELSGSAPSLGESLARLSAAAGLVRTIPEWDLEAVHQIMRGHNGTNQHQATHADSEPATSDAVYYDDRGLTGLSLFKPRM